VRIHSENE